MSGASNILVGAEGMTLDAAKRFLDTPSGLTEGLPQFQSPALSLKDTGGSEKLRTRGPRLRRFSEATTLLGFDARGEFSRTHLREFAKSLFWAEAGAPSFSTSLR